MTPSDLSASSLFAPFDPGGRWADLFEGVSHPWEVLGAHLRRHVAETVRPGILGTVHAGAFIVGDDVEIGVGSVVEPGAYIQGPCILGENVSVRHGAYVRGHVLAGDGAVIGHATEVKGSVFLPGAKAGHFAYVGDSLLGRDVNLGAGTKLANLRLAGDEVVIRCGSERLPTGLRKLGAILGDGVQTGCNSVTNPGTILGPRCRVLPCAAVGGCHPADAVVG